jgi:hypothetical protein
MVQHCRSGAPSHDMMKSHTKLSRELRDRKWTILRHFQSDHSFIDFHLTISLRASDPFDCYTVRHDVIKQTPLIFATTASELHYHQHVSSFLV